ncbi:MAG: FAD-binding protein [Acidobacteria bacterium]|nr:FAD-binding protein [Acidobacteriota bacterium]
MATSDKKLIRELEQILGKQGVLYQPQDLMLYEYDGSVEHARPDYVVFPRSTRDVVEIVRLANRYQVPMVGRGAGTGLSGGALARQGGIVLVFSRMNRILELDLENQRAVVQPGVVNLDLTRAVEHAGLYFAPDPSSQKSCTIGGNVAENAGGPHTLAYGVTANHVTGLELVLPEGDVIRVGGKTVEAPGYDLPGLLVGSEGTLAIITEITVKLSRLPEAVKTLLGVYDSVDDATETVVEITARGITPAACEMLDGWTLRAVEDYVHAGFPRDSAAVLLLEVEGLREAVEVHAAEISDVGVIPRTKLPATLRRIDEIGKSFGFQVGNIFHAGDGNLHPIILFDQRDLEQFARAVATANEIMKFCLEMGGALTGEHGVGMEKNELMPLMFTPADLDLMQRVRGAFNPSGLLNPGKLFPFGKGCGEIRVRPMPVSANAPGVSA